MRGKKYQVFISSTYEDLKEERQAAVDAILDAGHIPIGMEQFKAGNEAPQDVIKDSIDQSDIFMLILGGRYGSIDEKENKSYIQIEYEYAISKNKPVFSLVLTDRFLKQKAKNTQLIFENEYEREYRSFKKQVKSRLVRDINDSKDIKISVLTSLNEIQSRYPLSGWEKSNTIEQILADAERTKKICWEEYVHLIKGLHNKMIRSRALGGFDFDVVVGINKCGLITGVLLGRMYSTTIQILGIYSDRKNSNFKESTLKISNEYVINEINNNSAIVNILLIDTINRHGHTFKNAYEYFRSSISPDKTIKTALLVDNAKYSVDCDYLVGKVNCDDIEFPYNISLI